MFRPARGGLGEPLADTFGEMPVAAMDAISKDPVAPMGIVQHSEMLCDLSPTAIDALVGVAGAGSGSPLLMVEIRQLGGALARTPEHPHPMGGEARFSLNAIGATFTSGMTDGVAAHLARVAEAMRPYKTGEVFVNFLELNPASKRVRAAYPPEDWSRLVALKDERDPENLFRFNRNVPPSPAVPGSET
jgi:hypothetical protein